MKKLLCLVMSVLMAVPLMMTAFAVEQKTEAEFEKYNLSAETEVNGGGTDYDRGRFRLLASLSPPLYRFRSVLAEINIPFRKVP